MIINVMSQAGAEEASYRLTDKTAIISVRNNDAEPAVFCESSKLVGVKAISFADSSEAGPLSFSDSHALEIREFLISVLPNIDRLIVHCEFGVSRSAGIAAAIMKTLCGDDSAIFNDTWYVPNMRCYRHTLDALWDSEGNSLIGTMDCRFMGGIL